MNVTAAAGTDPALRALLTPEAVRERCEELWQRARRDELRHFAIDAQGLPRACSRVVDEIRRNYPSLAVPPHSRWRHFEHAGRDLWHEAWTGAGRGDTHACARSRFDLAFVSVLLDAGAGAAWRYRDAATGLERARSEGLAIASLRLFESGALSAAGTVDPLRCDAAALRALDTARLAAALQVAPDNPVTGLDGRASILRRLGEVMERRLCVFGRGSETRPGHLYDHLRAQAPASRLPARTILIALLAELGTIWPRGRRLGELHAGDVGVHPALRRDDASDTLVPFHKLSQWLAYSLLEPLADAGVTVTDPDGLTGLPEYRNGGLLVDCGLLRLRDERERERPQDPAGELVVEWRALTVAALDRIADGVRDALGLDAARLPLAAVLQGGTWSAGRRIAAELRPGGAPPIAVASDGTLF